MVKNYWNNVNSYLHAAERKVQNSIPDNIMRKTHNTLKQVNQAAIPLLGIISAVQPELTPLTGAISAGLVGGEALSNDLQRYDSYIDKRKAHFI